MNKVLISGVDTSTLPSLKPHEMQQFLIKLRTAPTAADREEARQSFIYGNLRLVLSIVHRFNNKKESSDDIFQVGIMGLVKAVDNFDPKFNVRFSTYAVPMIIGEIKRFLRDSSALRVSRSLRDTAYAALQMRDKLSKGVDYEPPLEAIARGLGLPLNEVAAALDAISEPVSLFDSAFSGSGNQESCELVDFVSNEKDSGDYVLDNIGLREAISRLSARERQIIDLRYFEGKTQIEVSTEVGISQAQVSRLEKNALKYIEKCL